MEDGRQENRGKQKAKSGLGRRKRIEERREEEARKEEK